MYSNCKTTVKNLFILWVRNYAYLSEGITIIEIITTCKIIAQYNFKYTKTYNENIIKVTEK